MLTVSSFGAAVKEHGKLFYNDAGFLLAMAIADGAIFGYESLEDIRQQEIPAGEDELILRFKDSVLEQPVLRQCTKTGGVSNEPMPKSSFTAILKSTLTNAGYLAGPSIHAIRRQLGKGVDSKSLTLTLVSISCMRQGFLTRHLGLPQLECITDPTTDFTSQSGTLPSNGLST